MLIATAWPSAEWVVALVVAAAAVWFIRRHGGGTAVSELSLVNDVLERRVEALNRENTRLQSDIAELRGRVDVAIAIETWGEGFEKRLEGRMAAMIVVLDLIAKRLGPDTDNDGA